MVDIEILGLVHLRFNVDWAITSLALFPVLRYPHGYDFFPHVIMELSLWQHFSVAHYPLIAHSWAHQLCTLWQSRAISTGTPCRVVTAAGLEYGCKTKGTSPPGETAAVLQIGSSYKFSQEPQLIAHIAFQSSDAHAIDWRHHTALHPTCCWVCASGKDLKLGLE